jgi:hypothetical protein
MYLICIRTSITFQNPQTITQGIDRVPGKVYEQRLGRRLQPFMLRMGQVCVLTQAREESLKGSRMDVVLLK